MPQNTGSTEILRDHEGRLHLYVDGRPVPGVVVAGLQTVGDNGMCATVFVPLQFAVLGEVRNVVPLVRPASREG